jgi:hypothetical protein
MGIKKETESVNTPGNQQSIILYAVDFPDQSLGGDLFPEKVGLKAGVQVA